MSTPRPTLAATDRSVTGKKVAALRREGRLPAVLFGHGVESRPISVDAHDFDLLRRRNGPNALVDLTVDGKKATPVLVHSVGVHPISRRPVHVDLFQVRMGEELTVDVPVVFVGESLAVDRAGGTLAHGLETIKVKALPANLPQSFQVAVDSLVDFESRLYVRDIELPAGVTLLTDPEEMLAHVLPPRVEEPVAGAEAAEPTEAAAGGASEAAAEPAGSAAESTES